MAHTIDELWTLAKTLQAAISFGLSNGAQITIGSATYTVWPDTVDGSGNVRLSSCDDASVILSYDGAWHFTDGSHTWIGSDVNPFGSYTCLGQPAATCTPQMPVDVWSNADRTLAGNASVVGPTAPLSDRDIHYQVFQTGTLPLCARVRTYSGADVKQADVSSIAYSIFELADDAPSARTDVTGHTAVALAKTAVIFDTIQSDAWASDYNFRFLPDNSTHECFAAAGTRYLVEVKLTMASGPKIIIRFIIHCI